MRLIDAELFIEEMRELYARNGWEDKDIHFSLRDLENMYNNSIPTQDAPVCNGTIKNKKPTIKELLDEQSSIIKDIRIYADQIADNIDLFCAEPEDNNKMEVRDLTTAILSNNDTLYLIRAKLSNISDKIG